MYVIISLFYGVMLYMIQCMYKRMFTQVYTTLYSYYTFVCLYGIVCYVTAILYNYSTIALYTSCPQARKLSTSYPSTCGQLFFDFGALMR